MASKNIKSRTQDGYENPDVYIHIGQRLAAMRKAKGFTQKQLATELGLGHQQYQKYETSETPIRIDRLLKLADVLNVNPIHILPIQPRVGTRRGMSEDAAPPLHPKDQKHDDLATEMLTAFMRLKDNDLKKTVLDHILMLVEKQR